MARLLSTSLKEHSLKVSGNLKLLNNIKKADLIRSAFCVIRATDKIATNEILITRIGTGHYTFTQTQLLSN